MTNDPFFFYTLFTLLYLHVIIYATSIMGSYTGLELPLCVTLNIVLQFRHDVYLNSEYQYFLC